MAKDLYKLLGVKSTASADEIKKAYRKLARKHHPDTNAGNTASEERFKEINEAYETLSDPDRRRSYDASRAPKPRSTRSSTGSSSGPRVDRVDDEAGFGDLLRNFFGQGTGAPPSMRGQDIEAVAQLSFADAYRGTQVTVSVDMPETCTKCHGRGKGRNDAPCKSCDGIGWFTTPKRYTVRVPAGIKDQARIRLRGKGMAGPGGEGDLWVLVQVADDPSFQRVDQDLIVNVSVPVLDAVLGGEVRVPLPFGAPIIVRVPEGSQPGRLLRVRGRGMPSEHGIDGDLLVRVDVRIPDQLTDTERALWNELRKEAQ